MYSQNQFNTSTSTRGRGQHFDESFYDYPPQPLAHQNSFGQISNRGYGHGPGHSYQPHQSYHTNFGQARGHQQRLPQRERLERPNPPRNQNSTHSQFHHERVNPNKDDHKIFVCPGCALHFDFINRNGRYTGRMPLILNCQHTVCQECISKGAGSNSVICPTCKKPSELPNKEFNDNLQEVFTPNYYLLGIIMWSKPQGNTFRQISLVPVQPTGHHKRLSSSLDATDSSEPEGERCCFLSCCKRAVLRCKDCNDVYCVECCTAVHKSAKSLWSHVQVQITNTNFSTELEKCPEHNSMDVEFYCSTCDTDACCYCFLDKHGGHEKVQLSKLNSDEKNEFQIYKEKAEQVLRQLIISQKKLKDLCSSGNSSLEKKICKYFADFHGQLYFIQKKLLREVSNVGGGGEPDNELRHINSCLENSIKTWKNIVGAAENSNVKSLNLRLLLQKLKEVELTPCYLLNDADGTPSSTEFHADPSLENLEDLFVVKRSTDNNLRLVSEFELPPDYVKDPADVQYESDVESAMTSFLHSTKKEESNQYNKRISSQSHSSHVKQKHSGQHQRKRIDKKVISDNEMVEVTHIESLECFYVQLKKHQSMFIQMNKDIENYVKMGANKVTTPELNELYLALYVAKSEKMWCRARLIDIKNQETNPLYEVNFIDFGSTQTLDITKLNEITPHLAQKKPFAIQCELYNPTYAAWAKNAHVYMGKIINGKDIYMVVKNVNNGVYQVDLMVSSSDRGLTSIIDLLIHTCSNALSSSSDSLNSGQRKESYAPEYKIFSNSFKFRKNQSERVVIANVVDPHNVFVHIAGYVDLLRAMASELKQYFKSRKSEKCIPIEGTYAVVEHRDLIRGNWHRAFIKKVDTLQGKAQVLLVDWGTNVTVPWSNVRMLTESFTKLETQAILVKLAHVEPHQGQQSWSERAIFFLQKNLRTQEPLKMTVYEVDPLEVALFETLGSINMCINAQLVQERLADSTGKISLTVEWPEEGDQEQAGFQEEEGFVESLLKKIDDSSNEDCDNEQEEAKTSVKQKIDIVKIINPDLIYIKFVHLTQQEQNLHKELQIHYNKEKTMKDDWEENEVCVVQLPDCYVRGKVMSKVDDKYKVNLFDRATELTLPKENLFVYSDYFKKFPNMVYKCHLANIRPAGGDKWSLSSIEALERTFDKYKDIFATKIASDPKKFSIPMLMWYTRTKVGGALEPTITKYISINNLLVKLGFAYKEPSRVTDEKKEERKAVEEDVDLVVVTSSKLDESTDSRESENDAKEKVSSASSAKDTTASSSDWNDMIEEEQQKSCDSKQDSPYHTKEMEITDWKPAFPIKKREFNAWITCAETEGILYLRDEDLQPVYKDMEANLKQYFDSQPPIQENPNWQPGQICTISYKDYWYRGKILKLVSPAEILALMIDFGSDHTLSPKQLCREILYPEIPAFASKVKLDRIYSKTGEWISSNYDMLLEIITEFAKVVIRGPLDVELPAAEIYNDKGQSVNELLVKHCSNLRRYISDESEKSDEDLALIEEEATLNLNLEKDLENQIDTTTMEYKLEPLPTEAFDDKILMHIVGVLAYNKIVLKQIEDTYDDLIALNVDIQDSISTQPNVETMEVGVPCICPYAEDSLWYRARIHNIDGIDCGYVFVFFVDFGNVESVSTDSIKMMKPTWFDLPVSCYIAEVNVELKTDNHLEHVLQHMKKLFTKNKLVHFVSEDPFVVELYEKTGELCYQSLLSNGLLKIK